MTPSEKAVYTTEEEHPLAQIKFTKFRAAVKKYGHQGPLKENHIKAISEELKNEKVTQFLLGKSTTDKEHLILKEENFIFDKGTYDTYMLLMVGFLYCSYENQEQHVSDLWLLVNHELHAKVNKGKVEHAISDLMHIAIDLRLSKLQFNAWGDKPPPYYFLKCILTIP